MSMKHLSIFGSTIARLINKSRLAVDSSPLVVFINPLTIITGASSLVQCAHIVVITILSTLIRANGPRCKLHGPALRLSSIGKSTLFFTLTLIEHPLRFIRA